MSIAFASDVTVTVQPFCRGSWEVFEPGVEPIYGSLVVAIRSARELLKDRSGVIEVRNSAGEITQVLDLRHEDIAA
jgi:hypothetical protein